VAILAVGRALAVAVAAMAIAAPRATSAAEAGPAGVLLARHAALKDKLDYNQFRRPLHLDSRETAAGISGEIHAVVDHPFATSGPALGLAPHWCDILLLHYNTKACRASTEGRETLLRVTMGRKLGPADPAHHVDFVFRVAEQRAGYLRATLAADEGPFGTRDYRILIEAIPVEGGRTFLRLAYSHGLGIPGRVAMLAYLSTAGRDKVGFTLLGTERGGQPHYVGGVRGVAERNTMRYYLAVEAFLGALASRPEDRAEKRRRDWFAASERYPRQLREMERSEYLAMKRKEALP
jgi:hypothetical protein